MDPVQEVAEVTAAPDAVLDVTPTLQQEVWAELGPDGKLKVAGREVPVPLTLEEAAAVMAVCSVTVPAFQDEVRRRVNAIYEMALARTQPAQPSEPPPVAMDFNAGTVSVGGKPPMRVGLDTMLTVHRLCNFPWGVAGADGQMVQAAYLPEIMQRLEKIYAAATISQ